MMGTLYDGDVVCILESLLKTTKVLGDLSCCFSPKEQSALNALCDELHVDVRFLQFFFDSLLVLLLELVWTGLCSATRRVPMFQIWLHNRLLDVLWSAFTVGSGNFSRTQPRWANSDA